MEHDPPQPPTDGTDMSPAFFMKLEVAFERLRSERTHRLEHRLREAGALWSRLGVAEEEERSLLERCVQGCWEHVCGTWPGLCQCRSKPAAQLLPISQGYVS